MVKHKLFVGVISQLALVSLCGCGGLGLSIDQPPFISRVEPCVGPIGTTVVIEGSALDQGGVPTVTMNGIACAVSSFDGGQVTVTIPAGATDGALHITNANGSANSTTFHIGNAGPQAEIEPNDDINGTNATDAWDTIGTGTLSTVLDKDHFRFHCLLTNKSYKVTLTPQIVGTVYINGVAKTFGPDGYFTFTPSADNAVIGLTGATGAYELKVEKL